MKNIKMLGFKEALEETEKKIGILTLYYNNFNYGGMLQAYALCCFLNRNGYNAEQICYVPYHKPQNIVQSSQSVIDIKTRRFLKIFNPRKLSRFVVGKIYNLIDKIKNRKWDIRISLFREFQNKIPHSRAIYYDDTITESNDIYYGFIAGSDQIWNPKWFTNTYFLSFAKPNKPKIAYGASLGSTSLKDKDKNVYREFLPSFDKISVREKRTAELLRPLCPSKEISYVVDPTLLLTKDEWDEICSARRIKKKYVLCYFLGEDTSSRKKAVEYARKNHLKIVNIPHLFPYMVTKSDLGFGDYKLFDVSPADFISLIKHSECVFTNSFHACVFSCIYQRNFFVFKRQDILNMEDRIYSLCELFHCEAHFCDTKEKDNINYILHVGDISFDVEFEDFYRLREFSGDFLLDEMKKIFNKSEQGERL